jgi:hypothetical protein
MPEKKVFSPSIMLVDSFKQSWCKNIENINGKVPIHIGLKDRGTYALNIKPTKEGEWFAFSLPLNSQWSPMNLSPFKTLNFELVSVSTFQLNVDFIDNTENRIQSEKLKIHNNDDWQTIQIKIDSKLKLENVKLLSFSGSSNVDNFLIKDIILK